MGKSGASTGFAARAHGASESESVHTKKNDERNATHETCYQRASESASGREGQSDNNNNDAVRRQLDAFYAALDPRPRNEKAQAQHEKNKGAAYETLRTGYTTDDAAFVAGKQARCLVIKNTGVVQLSALRKIVKVTPLDVTLGGTRKQLLASKTQVFVKI